MWEITRRWSFLSSWSNSLTSISSCLVRSGTCWTLNKKLKRSMFSSMKVTLRVFRKQKNQRGYHLHYRKNIVWKGWKARPPESYRGAQERNNWTVQREWIIEVVERKIIAERRRTDSADQHPQEPGNLQAARVGIQG